MNYRKESGEEVSKERWLMRNLWDVTTPRGKGVVTIPKKLKYSLSLVKGVCFKVIKKVTR
jgi:hypothetical protein